MIETLPEKTRKIPDPLVCNFDRLNNDVKEVIGLAKNLLPRDKSIQTLPQKQRDLVAYYVTLLLTGERISAGEIKSKGLDPDLVLQQARRVVRRYHINLSAFSGI